MSTLINGQLDFTGAAEQVWHLRQAARPHGDASAEYDWRPGPQDPEVLRRHAWAIGEGRPADGYSPPDNHVGVAMVAPGQGFAHWRIRQEWVDQTARHKGGAWQHCKLVLRLYDVSYINFNGFNAHR